MQTSIGSAERLLGDCPNLRRENFDLLLGLGVVSVPAGLVASALDKARQWEDDA
jgi:hypothetical protein